MTWSRTGLWKFFQKVLIKMKDDPIRQGVSEGGPKELAQYPVEHPES